MAVLRFLAGLFLLVAVVALVADLTPRLAGTGHPPLTTIARIWNGLAPDSLATAKTFVSHKASPLAWNLVIANLINMPLAALAGGLALFCGYFGRRRRRIEIFTN
jgi:hypothetical protein